MCIKTTLVVSTQVMTIVNIHAMTVGASSCSQVNGTVTNATRLRTTYICPSTGEQILPSLVNCANLIIDVRSM